MPSKKIKKSFSLVAWPQAYGQVEPINKTVKHNLKIKLESLKGRWGRWTTRVLYSYRTIAKTPIGETLFSFFYGCEVMVPVEIGMSSLRRESYDQDGNYIL